MAKQKVLLFLSLAAAFAACTKCDDEDNICTEEFRMVVVKVETASKMPVTLDSAYTIRQSNNERIRPQQQTAPGSYVVLDDSYQPKLKKGEDNFRFVGWRNSQVVVDQTYCITADNCHIMKRSGADSVTVQ